MENARNRVNGNSCFMRDMVNSHEKANGNGVAENGHSIKRRTSYQPVVKVTDSSNHKPENEEYDHLYPGMEYLEGEDGELSWFTAGVRVGVGIGLSVCLGIGIGVGLLQVRTYQGTTRNFYFDISATL